ncbi:hypothetical protein [Streptococcus iniae]|uniref:hypothetical protein n=1 Tax=Streptococcus iniae TaxID=1346 RepID=UPI000EF64C4F|nr:hypothetical protein [Streptococcus iniae]ELY5748925.1 hypothetical protein [Streptococcus iniae]ELY5750859.1 hypothetical protein [Streptococcus iniae]MCA1357628.1 hypothetical protein [Streptococcus iniae]RLU29614.1 hypothetical protein DIY14_09270 [Streptococcus iniae]RLU30592.1 hypothetical protein DIY21_08940 [Streptococcus iniae]
MTEELGVLLLDLPEPSWKFNYLCYENIDCHNKKLTVSSTNSSCEVNFYAHKCTRKEAEQFPQFKWVSLEGLK